METELLQKLRDDRALPFVEYKVLLEIAHRLLSSTDDNDYNRGLAIICHVAETKPSDPFIKQLLYDCIIASRIFLYEGMLHKFEESYFADSRDAFDSFAKSLYALDSGTILTKDQKKLFDEFQKSKKLIVSAPTSFGKSRIIPEIILANVYKSVAIVLPTIALLNETFVSLKNNHNFKDYTLVTSLTQPLGVGKNILILTPEKMDLFLDENPDFNLDFFVMDEIYKIKDDPERKQIFTHCLYRLAMSVESFYLIGPYFKKFSDKFIEKTGATFIKFDTEIVQKDVHRFHQVEQGSSLKIGDSEFKKFKGKDVDLMRIANGLDDSTFVYVGSKRTAEGLSKRLAEKRTTEADSDLIGYIRDNIAKDWSLVECLKKGVAFHHGAIPRYIQREIVDAFNDNELKVIVCTPTLIEGVNTSAKNVIIYDNYKGKEDNKLTALDVKNIKGRAGRLLVHFVGKVITLEEVNESDVGEIIDFSYFDDNNLNSEESVQVDKDDLDGDNLSKRKELESQLDGLGIPLSLVKGNKFISIENQIGLIKHLRANPSVRDSMSFDGTLPNKETLGAILQMCYDFLFSKRDQEDKSFYFPRLKGLVNYYVYKEPSIKELIAAQDGKTIDTKIRQAFNLITKYFEFLLPKYLVAFERLYNFSFPSDQPLNLKLLITKLEFGFKEKHEITLKEAGVPYGIIKKIEVNFRDCENLKQIKDKVYRNPSLLSTLTAFERKIFNKYV